MSWHHQHKSDHAYEYSCYGSILQVSVAVHRLFKEVGCFTLLDFHAQSTVASLSLINSSAQAGETPFAMHRRGKSPISFQHIINMLQ